MEQVYKIPQQAYSQAPWRRQTQWFGGFMLLVVVVSLIAWIYLSITAKAATIGRQIQDMRVSFDASKSVTDTTLLEKMVDRTSVEDDFLSIEELDIRIADLQAKLAQTRTQEQLRTKAQELGLQPYEPETALYIIVPGYTGRESPGLAGISIPVKKSSVLLADAYRQSLLDWLRRQFEATREMIVPEVVP